MITKRASRSSPDPDLAAWCEALAQTAIAPDVVPPGWQTVAQISKTTKIPTPTLQKKMQRLVAAGKAERKMFRVQLAKNVRPVPHYKLK
jgi:predicted transcriptional regulator